MLFQTFLELRRTLPELQLLIAPRNIERAEEIRTLAAPYKLNCRRWSTDPLPQGPILILDTIGELAACYAMATAVFIGGSLVAAGGHNPIEPAAAGVPVCFGPHMEDFAEIAAELVQRGGAVQVEPVQALLAALLPLFTDPTQHRAMAGAALECVRTNQGVVHRHLAAIRSLLGPPPAHG